MIAHRSRRSDGTRQLTGSILEQRSSPAKTAILVDVENLKRQPRSSSEVRDHLARYKGELRELLSGVRDLLTTLDGDAAKAGHELAGLLRDRPTPASASALGPAPRATASSSVPLRGRRDG